MRVGPSPRRPLLIVDSLPYRQNLPLTIHLCKRHVVRPARSNEFRGCNVPRHIKHGDLFRALCLRQVSAFAASCSLHQLGTGLLPDGNVSMNLVLQLMRMERSLHPDSVAGVIGFDVVRYRGTHGRRIVAGRVVALRIG